MDEPEQSDASDDLSRSADWEAEASNPAKIRINYLRYFASRPGPISIFLIVLAAIVVASAWLSWWILLGLVLVLPALALYLLRIGAHFMHGCANPGMIVSERPCLVAVFTDLTRDGESFWPVIKIIRQPLGRFGHEPVVLGGRVVTAAFYVPPEDEQSTRWDGFSPICIDCATGDRAEGRRCLESFAPAEWEALEAGLAQVPQPVKEGLYDVKIAEELERRLRGAEEVVDPIR
jgi:hypothetical protein